MMNPNYVKRSLRRYITIDKLSHRRYHINDFNTLIKILYPRRESLNKYDYLLENTSFTDRQKRMILQTAHSLVMINELYRDQDKYGRLYTTREDMTNAMYLLQNELDLQEQECMLTPPVRWFYKELQYYPKPTFTVREISRYLVKNKSTVYRNLIELTDRQMVSRIDTVARGAHIYKLNVLLSEKEI